MLQDEASVRASYRVHSGDQLFFELAPELRSTAGFESRSGTLDVEAFEYGPDDYSFAEPLSWHAELTNTGDALLVAGGVDGVARTDCARCLEDAIFEVHGELEGYFLFPDAELAQGADEDEFDRLPSSDSFDLEPLISAAITFELPYQPLCKEDCAGLCQHCGANLNEGPCDCANGEGPDEFELAKNPFAALADLKFDE